MFAFEKAIKKRGYKAKNVQYITVYSKVENKVLYIICSTEDSYIQKEYMKIEKGIHDDGYQPIGDMLYRYDIVSRWVRGLFEVDKYDDVKLLHIIISDNPEQFGETAVINDNYWLIRKIPIEVIVSENQPTDFNGIYELLDEKIHARRESAYIRLGFGTLFTYNNFIIILNILIFAITASVGNTRDVYYLYNCGALIVPLRGSELYRMITYAFLHTSKADIYCASVMLWAFGNRVEYIMGRTRYLLFYIVVCVGCALGEIIHCSIMGRYYIVMVGTMGVIGTMLAINIIDRIKIMGAKKFFKKKSSYLFILIFIGCIVLTDANVTYWGHLFGLVSGILFYYVSRYIAKRKGYE